MASALVGTVKRPPKWATNDLRVTAGTSIEFLGKLPTSVPCSRCAATELLMLLIAAFEIKNANLAVLVSVLLAGVIPENFPVAFGTVLCGLPASSASYALRDDDEWQTAYALLGSTPTATAVVTNHRGDTVYEPHMESLSNAMIYPLKVVLSDPKRANWPSKKCILEETGLGGSDLPFPDKAVIVGTDRRKQNIYGPSMTTVEPFADCHIFGTTAITALAP